MKQYCRYCVNLYCGEQTNKGWCEAHQKWYARTTCFAPNNCKDYQLVNCLEEYQDAFMENVNGYKPQETRKQKINDGEQETMF